MTRIIFHLGTYKTGTSTIQNHLFENRDALLENGLLYPEFGVTNGRGQGHRHTPIAHKFIIGEQAAVPEGLLEEIWACKCDTVVLSSEGWSSPHTFAHINQAVTMMKAEGFADVSAILILRNRTDYRVSHFREFTRHRGNRKTYRNYLISRHAVFDYLLLVRFFRALFGTGLTVLSYEDSEDSLQSFKEVVGVGVFEGIEPPGAWTNTKQEDALDVEIIRCLTVAGEAKQRADDLRSMLAPLSEGAQGWTERFLGDHENFSATYRRELAELSGLSAAAVDVLLADRDIIGTPVLQMTAQIEALLGQTRSRWPWKR